MRLDTVNPDRHLLTAFVDCDEDIGAGLLIRSVGLLLICIGRGIGLRLIGLRLFIRFIGSLVSGSGWSGLRLFIRFIGSLGSGWSGLRLFIRFMGSLVSGSGWSGLRLLGRGSGFRLCGGRIGLGPHAGGIYEHRRKEGEDE
jgi:hypothetical protein